MPHINRVRVNNVKYNFGTQFYDDFMMRFSCKNTIYDLANGGGKSVLMLLLLQNLIPNCTLDDKQPIEKLFRTNEGSTTIHSMIEWSLSEPQIHNNYKYMLTGFCARKAKEEYSQEESAVKNGAAIEYFNYCIFYRNYNDNDIKNFPLVKNGERITYTGLKNYLKELDKSDLSLEVRIFEKKGDYQRFICNYGLYESEWEIIRGINKTEGHVRTYFETNYKTARKVVEDLLIEEIIEKSFRNRYASNEDENKLAETLLSIKDKLLELSKKKEEIHNYDRQIDMIDSFITRIQSIKQLYDGIDLAFTKLQKADNTIKKLENDNKNVLADAASEKLTLRKEKDSLAQKVMTAKVIVDTNNLNEMSTGIDNLNKQLAEIKESKESLSQILSHALACNYYLDYIEYKGAYEKIKQVIHNSMQDHQELLSQMKELVIMKKNMDDKKKEELEQRLEKEREISKHELKNVEELNTDFRTIDNKLAVLEFKIQQFQQEAEQKNQLLLEEKKNTSILLATDATQAMRNLTQKMEDSEKLINQLQEKKEGIITQIQSDLLEKKTLQIRFQTLQNTFENLKSNQNQSDESSHKIKKLKEVYSQNDIKMLLSKIKEIYRNMVIDTDKTEKCIQKKVEEMISLKDCKPFMESEEAKKVLEYINRYHGNVAVFGTDYMKNLDKAQRKKILENLPLVPYAIIIKQNFDQIKYDERIFTLIEYEKVIILVNESQITNLLEDTLVADGLCFLHKENLSFEMEVCQKQVEEKANELESLKKQLARKKESETIVREDYEFLLTYQIAGLESEKERYEKTKQELFDCESKQNQLTSLIEDKKQEQIQIESKISMLNKQKEEMTEEYQNLRKVKEALDSYRVSEEALTKTKEEQLICKKEYENIQKRQIATKNMAENRVNLIKNLSAQMTKIEEEWNKLYAKYYDERNNLNQNLKSIYTNEELDIKLSALQENLLEENSSLSDKEQLLNNYQNSVEKTLSRIKYLDLDISQLEQEYKENGMYKKNSDELKEIRQKIDAYTKEEKERGDIISKLCSKRDTLQGKITHAISVISEKYGYYEPECIKNEEVYTYLNENDEILSQIEEKIVNVNNQLEQYETAALTIKMLKRDIEKLMEKSGIKQNVEIGMYESSENLEQEFKKISDEIEHHVEEKYKRNDEFNRERNILTDTLEKLSATELAREIRNSIHMPKDTEQTNEMIKTLTEINQFTKLEKQRVLKGLEDIQIIKDNFENQCIQSCINIRTELDRLSKLSKIAMDNKSISMINLKVPYIKEEFYKEKMSEYIDNIAKMTDSFESAQDKLKYIRNNLCWKKLFSVIVSDMNAIKLNLYKRERIASQSRYLPYEEAVGSTGQSQGIYIQFLISIINYITSINSKNSDASKLKKVIFIDNPFGAAKDIYIWEPIFKLLKINNVQLIVPARGATPAITGRFDVNYVLGQKMCGNKQQTVVVDYFSNVEKDALDYTTLSYEQTALF